MGKTSVEYFELLALMQKDAKGLGKAALNSLDIIDTKAGGVAGLIGGFSAASTFLLQMLSSGDAASIAKVLVALSLALFSISAALCGSCLYIMSRWHERLLAGVEGLADPAKVANASEKILKIYDGRVGRYLLSLYTLFGGIIILGIAVICHLARSFA
jgi:hypothetical protein